MYSKNITWQQWIQADENLSIALLEAVKHGKDQFDKWNQFVYGLTDEQILVLFPGRTIQELIDHKYALGVFNDMYTALEGGGTLPDFKRYNYLLPFIWGNF